MTRLLFALLGSLLLAALAAPFDATAQGAASGAQTSGTPASASQGTGEQPIGGRPAGVQLTAPQVAGAQAARSAEAGAQGAGDPVAGAKKATQCFGCHSIPGYQASFPEVHKVPMIAGQSAKYLVAALVAYRKGERKHPTMRAIGVNLSDQDMADVAVYYEQIGKSEGAPPTLAPAAPPADVQALLGKMNCASCHGANFSSPIDPTYPKLAGQHADYLYVALKAYQTDRAAVGRANAIMKGMAAPYSHAELKKIAQYLGSLPGELKVVPQPRFKR